MMNELEKSDSCIVAEKPMNKFAPAEAESVEPRRETKGNTAEAHMRRTQSRVSVELGLVRVRERAKARKQGSKSSSPTCCTMSLWTHYGHRITR